MDQEQLLKLLAVLRRHGWILVQSVLTVAVAAAYFASRAPDPPYVATASLVYDVRSTTADPSVADPTSGLTEPFLRRQTLVLGGSEFLSTVVKELPGETVDGLRRSVRASVDVRSGLINLRSQSVNPQQAFARVTTVASVFEGSKYNDISRSLRERSVELDTQITSLETRLEKINQRLLDATTNGRDTSLFTAQQSTALAQYTALFASQQRLLNQIAVQRRPMVILDAGTVTRDASPSPVRRGLLGASIGFVLGAGLVALRTLLDGRLRSVEQAEELIGLPVLGELPRLTPRSRLRRSDRRRRRAHQRRLLVLHDPTGAGAEAFRKLRTAVLFQRADHRLATLAITSPDAGGDKTAVAANLAAAFAGSGLRTILVSADIRGSDLGRWFSIVDQPGLHELLGDWTELKRREQFSERADVLELGSAAKSLRVRNLLELGEDATPEDDAEDVVGSYLLRSPTVARLRLLPASRTAVASAERLSSPDAVSLVSQLASMADIVVFDCAPMSTADGAVVASLADATLVVLSRNVTRAADAERAVKQLRLAGASPIGVVVTRCESEKQPVRGVARAPSRHPAATSMVRPDASKSEPGGDPATESAALTTQ